MFSSTADHAQGMACISFDFDQAAILYSHLDPTSGRTDATNALFPFQILHLVLN
jgi:hypothetical protein